VGEWPVGGREVEGVQCFSKKHPMSEKHDGVNWGPNNQGRTNDLTLAVWVKRPVEEPIFKNETGFWYQKGGGHVGRRKLIKVGVSSVMGGVKERGKGKARF